MGLAQTVSADAVTEAIAECDRLTRPVFLAKYGYGPAKSYYIEYRGRYYDSKAIVGVAYGYQRPEDGPLKARQFSGGKGVVQPMLTRLGFTVVQRSKIPREERS